MPSSGALLLAWRSWGRPGINVSGVDPIPLLGARVERTLDKMGPSLGTWLDPSEEVVAAFRVQKLRPALDLLVITNRRLFAAPVPAKASPTVEVPLGEVDHLTFGATDNVTVHRVDGTVVKVGQLRSRKDIPRVSAGLELAHRS